jgi:hypothetical protein
MAFNSTTNKVSRVNKKPIHAEMTVEEIYKTLPVYSTKDKVLIIDGDILAYRVATVCEFKHLWTHKSTGEEIRSKSKGEFEKHCTKKGLDIDMFDCVDDVKPEPLSMVHSTLEESLQGLLTFTGCNVYEIYVTGSDIFRNDLPLPTQYKDCRSQPRPHWLKQAKDRLVKKFGAYIVKGVEPDDIEQRRIRDLYFEKIKVILYSNDKDARQGIDYKTMMFNPDLRDISFYKGGIGELYDTSAGVKGYGLKWLLFQTAIFDKIDNYKMNSHYIKRYGEKSFYKDFNGCTDCKILIESVMRLWKERLPEITSYTSFDGKKIEYTRLELVELYYACAKMQDGIFHTFKELCEHYGVAYEL